MSWQGYVPTSVIEKYGNSPVMAELIKTYGMLAKHEPNDARILFLFDEIWRHKEALEKVDVTLDTLQAYVEQLEMRLLKASVSGMKDSL
jgi:hypothetical protein